MRQKLIPETWRERHDALWSELLEEPESNLPIDKELSRYHDLSALLMCDISGLRICHLKMISNGNESVESKKLGELINRLDKTVLEKTTLPDTYWSGRTDRKIPPAEDIAFRHQIMNRILYSAIGEAEAWLCKLKMTPVADPDQLLDEMIEDLSDDDGND